VEAQPTQNSQRSDSSTSGSHPVTTAEQLNTEQSNTGQSPTLRRSTRARKVPERFREYT